MKKIVSLLILLSSTIFANEAERFFKESDKNVLFCRVGYETYLKISQKNASLEEINGSQYFHFKKKDLYFPISGCHPIKKEDKGLIF